MSPLRKLSFSAPSRGGRLLALLTAVSVASALLYVFVLLVPAWRSVRVDRRLIGAFLTNHSADARLWEAFERDPLLRSRSANAFRECLSGGDGSGNNGDKSDDRSGNSTAAAGKDGNRSQQSRDHGVAKILQQHLLELLAGANVTLPTLPPTRTTTTASTTSQPRPHPSRSAALSNERCWFLNLHWSDGAASTISGEGLLRCKRALFLLAVTTLLCHCVGLTGALYACFASKMAQSCRLVLLIVHCLTVSQLVALAILQDVSARLAGERLRDLLSAAGFPDGCETAVGAHRGVCSLALLCVLCVASGLCLLLLLLLPATAAYNPIVAASAGKQQPQHDEEDGDGEKMLSGAGAEGEGNDDAAEDRNPLIM